MVFPVNCEARPWAENGTREGMWEARRENREWESIVFKTGNGKYWKLKMHIMHLTSQTL